MRASPVHQPLRFSVAKSGGHGGFTLIELLVVMSIIALLVTLVTPAASSILRGSAITQAADMVVGQLALARQTALTDNRAVEVRLYRFADPLVPGESAATPGSAKFHAMQTFEMLESGTAFRALGKIQPLPGNTVIIDSGVTLSSIIGKATSSSSTPSLTKGSALGVSIPSVGLNYDSVAFRFLPDGSTNLPPQTVSQLWFLTLHGSVYGDQLSKPPANFATIQINTTNGKIRTFHP